MAFAASALLVDIGSWWLAKLSAGLAVLVRSKQAFEKMPGLRASMQRTHLALLEGVLGEPGATGGFQAEAPLGEQSRGREPAVPSESRSSLVLSSREATEP